MKTIRLWMLRVRAWNLEQQAITAEVRIREQRAYLQNCYRELRQVQQRIGELTPAHQLLAQLIRSRRDLSRGGNVGGQQPKIEVASRQHRVYR